MPSRQLRLTTWGALLLSAGLTLARAADTGHVTPQEAAKLVADGKAVLVDVREKDEWAETGVAVPAHLLATTDFNHNAKNWSDFLATVSDKTVITYCSAGIRAGRIADKLATKGFKTASMGRFEDWTEAGLPVRKVDGK